MKKLLKCLCWIADDSVVKRRKKMRLSPARRSLAITCVVQLFAPFATSKGCLTTRLLLPLWVMCGRRPFGKAFLMFMHIGRVQSCVRPVYVALIAAGPNAIRRSGPNQKHALVVRPDPNGFSRSSVRPILHYITFTLPNYCIRSTSCVLFGGNR